MKKKIFYRKEKKEKARGGGLEALLDSAERSRCTHTNSLSLTRARARAHTHDIHTGRRVVLRRRDGGRESGRERWRVEKVVGGWVDGFGLVRACVREIPLYGH